MELYLSGSPGEVRVALTDQGSLQDIALWRPGLPDGWGDIHDVRITSIAPALGGAFIVTGTGEEGFLTSRKKLTEGSLLCAQLIRCAQNAKGARFKPIARPEGLSPPSAPRLLKHGPSPLEELADAHCDAPLFVDDMAVAAQLPSRLRARVKRVPCSFHDDLENQWDDLALPSFSLGALTAHISPTPALTAIDLDSASRPHFTTNIECFPSLLRLIRLRNLSGTLLIDPAGVRSRKRPALVSFLRDAVERENDPLAPQVTGITPSGLLEMTRPRRRPPLHELLSSPHGKALSLLRSIVREKQSGETLYAPPDIIRALENDPHALEEAIRLRCAPLNLQIMPRSSPSCWKLS